MPPSMSCALPATADRHAEPRRPFKTEFLILYAAQVALDAAAHFFTGDPDFCALRPDPSRAGERPR